MGKAFIALIVAAFFTLGLALPLYWAYRNYFLVSNLAYGQTKFNYKLDAQAFYILAAQLFGFLLYLMLLVRVITLFWLSTPLSINEHTASLYENTEDFKVLSFFIGIIVSYLVTIAIYSFIKAMFHANSSNIVWNKVSIKSIRVESKLTTAGLFRIYFNNILLTLLTIGFYTPWAVTNIIRYRLDHTQLRLSEDLDNFVSQASQQQGSVAEGVDDIIGIEISL